jgi:DNA-binding transcriptional regulator/RsmH inhibitor MraZ
MIADGKEISLPLGTYKRVLDQKLRMIIPAIWREPPIFKGDTGYITLRRPYRLVLLPHDFVKSISKSKLKGISIREKEAIRHLLTTMHSVQLDQRGRITVPHELVQALDLTPGDEMIVTASGGWLEIWPSREWERGKAIHGLFNQRS